MACMRRCGFGSQRAEGMAVPAAGGLRGAPGGLQGNAAAAAGCAASRFASSPPPRRCTRAFPLPGRRPGRLRPHHPCAGGGGAGRQQQLRLAARLLVHQAVRAPGHPADRAAGHGDRPHRRRGSGRGGQRRPRLGVAGLHRRCQRRHGGHARGGEAGAGAGRGRQGGAALRRCARVLGRRVASWAEGGPPVCQSRWSEPGRVPCCAQPSPPLRPPSPQVLESVPSPLACCRACRAKGAGTANVWNYCGVPGGCTYALGSGGSISLQPGQCELRYSLAVTMASGERHAHVVHTPATTYPALGSAHWPGDGCRNRGVC